MSTPLLPQAFWFRLSIPCRRIDGLPRTGPRGRLLDLPESCSLPDLSQLEGGRSWAEVRVAWSPSGLAVAIEATGNTGPMTFDEGPTLAHGAQIWIDTRDTRGIHRASRFCHRFTVKLAPGGSRSALEVELAQRPIARAVADAPTCKIESLSARAERISGGWRLELFFPSEALHGFDPETNRRLGFAYQVSDPAREDQFLGVGREFPIGEDPSLWSTLELREP
jgi:hypothetical protein